MDLGEITTREVRAALAKIRCAHSLRGSRLIEMAAVRQLLREEGMSASETGLEWALGTLLYETAHRRLSQLRGWANSDTDLSPDEEHSHLEDDFRSGSVKLEAWSGLYYRFLCPSLQLGASELAAVALPDHRGRSGQRLYQRRVQHAVSELTAILRDLERDARTSERLATRRREPGAGAVHPLVRTVVGRGL